MDLLPPSPRSTCTYLSLSVVIYIIISFGEQLSIVVYLYLYFIFIYIFILYTSLCIFNRFNTNTGLFDVNGTPFGSVTTTLQWKYYTSGSKSYLAHVRRFHHSLSIHLYIYLYHPCICVALIYQIFINILHSPGKYKWMYDLSILGSHNHINDYYVIHRSFLYRLGFNSKTYERYYYKSHQS